MCNRGGFADLPDFVDGFIGHGRDELVSSGSDLVGVLVGDVWEHSAGSKSQSVETDASTVTGTSTATISGLSS